MNFPDYDKMRPRFGTRYDRFTPNSIDIEREKAATLVDGLKYDAQYKKSLKTAFCIKCKQEKTTIGGQRKKLTDGTDRRVFVCGDCACKFVETLVVARPDLECQYSHTNTIPFELLRVDGGTKVLWSCPSCKENWLDTPARRVGGADCPGCKRLHVAKKKQSDINIKESKRAAKDKAHFDKLKEKVEAVGWNLIEEEWKGSGAYYELRCPSGHKNIKLPSKIDANLKCRKCITKP